MIAAAARLLDPKPAAPVAEARPAPPGDRGFRDRLKEAEPVRERPATETEKSRGPRAEDTPVEEPAGIEASRSAEAEPAEAEAAVAEAPAEEVEADVSEEASVPDEVEEYGRSFTFSFTVDLGPPPAEASVDAALPVDGRGRGRPALRELHGRRGRGWPP